MFLLLVFNYIVVLFSTTSSKAEILVFFLLQ